MTINVNDIVNKHIHSEVLRVEAERDEAQVLVGKLESQLRMAKAEVAGYKLAARLLGKFPRACAAFTARCATVAYFYR